MEQPHRDPSHHAEGRQRGNHEDQDQAIAQPVHNYLESGLRSSNWNGADSADQRSCCGRDGRLKISISVARLIPDVSARGSLDPTLRISRRAQSCWPDGTLEAGITILSKHQDSALEAERRVRERRKSLTRTTENFSSHTS